ncbi:MAG: hypothetical protein R3C32_00780 [Chloroflexota bacterium]
MSDLDERVRDNRASWDERAPAHATSPDYAFDRFATDPAFISTSCGSTSHGCDIAGLRGVHLQCHIGTDTVSLARLGARMTGLDFSAPCARGGRPPVRTRRRRHRLRRGGAV